MLMVDDVLVSAEERMQKALASLSEGFSAVRTGRANAMVLDKIRIDYYGVPTPINQVAAIKTPDAHLLVIEPWEKSMIRPIEQAIMKSELGVTPSNDGTCIRLPFPSLTEERRKELVKLCRTYSEEARVAVRNARRDANAMLEKMEKDEGLREDDAKRATAEVQKLTDKYIGEVETALKKKEAEVMEI